MSNPVTAANQQALLAAEILVEQIGIELAQMVNTPETVWVKQLEGSKTTTAHYRWENSFSTAIPPTAVEGSTLPSGNATFSEQTIATAFQGQSIQIGVNLDALDPEAMASISKRTNTVLEREIDSGVCGLYTAFTQNSVGNSTAALTISTIEQANALLDAVHADQIGQYKGRLHPQQFADLYNDFKNSQFGISKITSDAEGRTQINIGETILLKNTFVPIVNSGATYNGGIYVREAIGLVVGMAPRVVINYVGGTGLWYCDGLLSIGVGGLRTNLGVPVLSGINA